MCRTEHREDIQISKIPHFLLTFLQGDAAKVKFPNKEIFLFQQAAVLPPHTLEHQHANPLAESLRAPTKTCHV